VRGAETDTAGAAYGQRRRIAIVVSFWAAGGAPQVAGRIGVELQARGHDVEVWYLYRRTDLPLPPGPCRILADRNVARSAGYAALPWRVLCELRRFRPDAVISFSPLAHVLGQSAALLAGVPARVPSHRAVCTVYNPLLRALDRLFGTLGVYTRIVAVSEAVRQSVAGYAAAYRRRVEVIHNGVDRSAAPAIGRAAARAALDLPADAPIILAVGRLAAQKNYPLLLEAVAPLAGVHLVIAGGGSQREALERQAARLGLAGRLRLLGHVPPETVAQLYRACDVFALASLFEGQSNALLEAMAEGLPIAASDIPEQAETVIDTAGRRAALLLPLGDAAAWTAGLRRLLDDPALARSLGEAARARAADFTVARMIDRFEALAL
jgi:glycosyltransferase involved in cell wall biosynthesis